jgi:hypothetical protein
MKVMRVNNVDVVGVFKSTGVGGFGKYFCIGYLKNIENTFAMVHFIHTNGSMRATM